MLIYLKFSHIFQFLLTDLIILLTLFSLSKKVRSKNERDSNRKGKMYRRLKEKELQWIDKLMDVEFQGRDILLQQLSKAKIIYTQEYAFISIKFKVEGEIEPYPYHVRVPVEMRAFQQSSAPILFLLHIVDGMIDELEILTADSTQIDTDHIELERVEYEIDQEVNIKNEHEVFNDQIL